MFGGMEGDNWVLKGIVIEKWVFGKYLIIMVVEYFVIYNLME